jgi:hypothetical protein
MILSKKSILYPDQVLDIVLEDMVLWQSKNSGYQTIVDLADRVLDYLHENYLIDSSIVDISSIFDQLEEDKYIKCSDDSAIKEKRQYYVTFKGAWFIKNNGYSGKIEDRLNDKLRLEKLEYNQKANSNSMTFLTVVLTLTGIVGTVYSFLEIRTHHSGFYQIVSPYFNSVISVSVIIISILIPLLCLTRRKWEKRKKAYKRSLE